MPWEIIKPGTRVDFIGKRRLAAIVSLTVMAASLVGVAVRGVRLGVDFAGGTEIQVQFAAGAPVSDADIRKVLTDALEIRDPSVIRYGDPEENSFLLRFAGNINDGADPSGAESRDAGDADVVGSDLISNLEQALRGDIGAVTIQRVEFVGPRVGKDLRNNGLKALLYASLAILVYIAFRFNTRFAPGAIIASIHDLWVTAGIFVLLGMEFDLQILAAMLAILGYSLNDTVVIYDRIRENMALHTSLELPEVLNASINQTLSRTVLTGSTTLMTLIALYVFGGEVMRPFAVAMILGIIIGTYSSIYIASPVLLVLERRFGGGAATQAAVAERKQQGKQHPGARGGAGKAARRSS